MYHTNAAPDYSSSTASEPARLPQVQEQFNQLESIVEANLKLQGELEQRLSGVLRSEPQAAGNAQKDDLTIVGMAQHVRDVVSRLERLSDGYASMIRRLEL